MNILPTGAARPRSRRNLVLAAIAAFAITASTLTAGPAQGAGVDAGGAVAAGVYSAGVDAAGVDAAGVDAAGVDAAGVENVLRQAGAVVDVAPVPAESKQKLAQPDAASGGIAARSQRPVPSSISLDTGLSVPSGTNTVSITPVLESAVLESAVVATGAAKALSPSGLAVYGNTADSSIAFSKASTGGNAGYAVITGPDAPTTYRFAFAVDGEPAVLRPTDGGGVDVLSANGTLVNSVAPAWAKDATGADVATSYSVSGNVLVQSVSHEGAAYPVVADPRVRCDSLWCTLELSRGETRSLAANVLYAGGPCAVLGGGAPVCVTVLTGAWAMASIAISRGQCVGYRVWKANFVSYPHLAYVGCYA